jgi:hypothetical protein
MLISLALALDEGEKPYLPISDSYISEPVFLGFFPHHVFLSQFLACPYFESFNIQNKVSTSVKKVSVVSTNRSKGGFRI